MENEPIKPEDLPLFQPLQIDTENGWPWSGQFAKFGNTLCGASGIPIRKHSSNDGQFSFNEAQHPWNSVAVQSPALHRQEYQVIVPQSLDSFSPWENLSQSISCPVCCTHF